MPNFRHGKQAHVGVFLAGSTWDLSDTLDGAELHRLVDTAEVTHFLDDDREYLAGLRGAEFSLSGHYDKTDADLLVDYLGSTYLPRFNYGPESTQVGRTRYEFDAIIVDFDIRSPVGDRVIVGGKAVIASDVLSTTYQSGSIG